MKAVCTHNPDHKRFITVAHEVHDWVVDEQGDFIKDLGCIETAHKPMKGNSWTCEVCGAVAEVT